MYREAQWWAASEKSRKREQDGEKKIGFKFSGRYHRTQGCEALHVNSRLAKENFSDARESLSRPRKVAYC